MKYVLVQVEKPEELLIDCDELIIDKDKAHFLGKDETGLPFTLYYIHIARVHTIHAIELVPVWLGGKFN